MSITFRKEDAVWQILLNGRHALTIQVPCGCTDSFELLDEKAFRWTRSCEKPTDHMKMTLRGQFKPRYFQVPSVNYNGNGWGSGAQYYGYCDNGKPWVYAWHRTSIPACTYIESDEYAVALFGGEEGGMSCSVYPDGEESIQELIWPETEGPRVLQKRFWDGPYQGTMEPATTFTGIVMLMEAGKPREKVKELQDFAWRFFRREVKMPYSPERVRQLDMLYRRQLWHRMYNGITGFASGMNWNDAQGSFIHHIPSIEIGWVGQNAAQSCALLDLYLEDGDTDARDKALSVLDSWDKYAFLPNGLMFVNLMEIPERLDSAVNGDIPVTLDACNLGTAATYFFRATKLCKKAGIERPSYEKRAFGLCDFFVRAQQENGEFAKAYFLDGSISARHGSIGAFIVLPLLDAYELTGEEKYWDAAIRGLDFYLSEFDRFGYTTAGALDSNCIDKESAAPILRAALRIYELKKEQKYLDEAIELGYYLATWQWHYTVKYSADTMLGQLGFDTYGSTAVSAAHNALDHYGLYWIPEYLKLAEYTGNDMWRQRARALWYSGTQLLSDGTLVIKGRVRPAGSQDESARHTRWSRPDHRCFVSSEWCTGWQGTFRYMVQEMIKDWDILR